MGTVASGGYSPACKHTASQLQAKRAGESSMLSLAWTDLDIQETRKA